MTALILLAHGAQRPTVLDELALPVEAGVAVKAECLGAAVEP